MPSTSGPGRFGQSTETHDTEAVLDLREVLTRLAPGQGRALVLRDPWDLSVEETAAALGIAPGTVKSQTADAVTRLRALLEIVVSHDWAGAGHVASLEDGGTSTPALGRTDHYLRAVAADRA